MVVVSIDTRQVACNHLPVSQCHESPLARLAPIPRRRSCSNQNTPKFIHKLTETQHGKTAYEQVLSTRYASDLGALLDAHPNVLCFSSGLDRWQGISFFMMDSQCRLIHSIFYWCGLCPSRLYISLQFAITRMVVTFFITEHLCLNFRTRFMRSSIAMVQFATAFLMQCLSHR